MKICGYRYKYIRMGIAKYLSTQVRIWILLIGMHIMGLATSKKGTKQKYFSCAL